MKRIVQLMVIMMVLPQFTFSQDVTTVEAKSSDISENLDLEAVASVFGDSENLEDFEKRLNDPETQISNLDLNDDGYVDYLRVVENSESNTILITIQAVLGDNIYQDVATIDVEKDDDGETYVQVVGDVYMYGPDYIITPVFVAPPPVVLFFWAPHYVRWHSPYYWHHYPPHFHVWHPHPVHVYHSNVHVHVNVHHTYHHTTVRRSTTAVHIHSTTRRNDYGRSYPDRSFSSRNDGYTNKRDLNSQSGTVRQSSTNRGTATQSRSGSTNSRSSTGTVRSSSGQSKSTGAGTAKSTGKKVQNDWKSGSNSKSNGQVRSTRQSDSKSNRQTSTRSSQTRQSQSNRSGNVSSSSRNSGQSNRSGNNSRSGSRQKSERKKRR